MLERDGHPAAVRIAPETSTELILFQFKTHSKFEYYQKFSFIS